MVGTLDARAPTVDDLAATAARELDGAEPVEVVRWALARLGDRYVIATSFQAGSLAVVDMARRVLGGRVRVSRSGAVDPPAGVRVSRSGAVDPPAGVRVVFLDTGFHFPETLAFRDRLVEEWDLEVVRAAGPGALGTQEAGWGHALWDRDPDRCCFLNKVAPLQRALHDVDGWLTGLRRDEAPTRAGARTVEPYPLRDGRTVLKINPIVAWSRRDLWHYVRERDIPTHPLFDRGYLSVGCAPCTRPVQPGEELRAGRWAGTGKTECGIHQPAADGTGAGGSIDPP